jgi:tetratricopeptide (TPR) repeat protein
LVSRQRWHAWLLALGLAALVVALYWPVRDHGFVSYDDETYLTGNPHVAKGLAWSEVRWAFTHAHAANYHPLTWLAHMLDVELFGLASGPHHLVNVALHALNAVLVLFLARELLGSLAAAAFAAALFALHPLRVESVAWASERKDVLCALFYLGALLLYLRYARAPSGARYALVLGALALALLAKPMAVSLPFAALLLDVWPLRRLDPARPWRTSTAVDRRLWLEKLPLLALAVLGALSTWLAQEVGGAASGMQAVPLDLRVLNAVSACGVYLRQTLLPAGLAAFYPLAALVEERPRATLLAPALGTLLALLALGLLAWRARERAPWLLVGLLWFLGLLVPVIGLKQVGMQAHADRYTYLPLLGMAWSLAGAGLALARRSRRLRLAVVPVALASLAALAGATRTQLAVWRDTRSLFEHALAVTEKNYVAHAALAAVDLDAGRTEEARAHVERALELYGLDASALTTLARLELAAGDPRAAEQALQRAKQVHGSKWVRYQMGRVKLALGNQEAAAREFAAALALDPSLVDAHYNLGLVLFGLGRTDEARACFERALALAPHAGAHNGLGVVALEAGAPEAALRHFERAVEVDPRYPDALDNLALALERLGRAEEARERRAEARALRETRRP